MNSVKTVVRAFFCSKIKNGCEIIIVYCFQERIARYVSMIPFISDSAAFPDLCDIWATSEVSINGDLLFARLHNLFCSFQKPTALHLGIGPLLMLHLFYGTCCH